MGSNNCAMSRVGMGFAWEETGVDKCVSLCWTLERQAQHKYKHKTITSCYDCSSL